MIIYSEWALKAVGEVYHKAGRLVWLVGHRVTVNRQEGPPFGKVAEDSISPDEWVKIDIYSKHPGFLKWEKESPIKPKGIK